MISRLRDNARNLPSFLPAYSSCQSLFVNINKATVRLSCHPRSYVFSRFFPASRLPYPPPVHMGKVKLKILALVVLLSRLSHGEDLRDSYAKKGDINSDLIEMVVNKTNVQ